MTTHYMCGCGNRIQETAATQERLSVIMVSSVSLMSNSSRGAATGSDNVTRCSYIILPDCYSAV